MAVATFTLCPVVSRGTWGSKLSTLCWLFIIIHLLCYWWTMSCQRWISYKVQEHLAATADKEVTTTSKGKRGSFFLVETPVLFSQGIMNWALFDTNWLFILLSQRWWFCCHCNVLFAVRSNTWWPSPGTVSRDSQILVRMYVRCHGAKHGPPVVHIDKW